ncbi:CE128 protein, partial [Asarcornis scutulata]|nr:CE128 protein [Asarcornis scutulata]
STRVALDHLESVPEKLSLLEDFKDTASHCRREKIEERYTKYKEIVSSLQQQLEDSKQRIQQFKVCVCIPLFLFIFIWLPQDVVMDADISDIQVAAPSSSWRTQNSFLSTSLLSES